MNNKFWDSPAWTMGHRKDLFAKGNKGSNAPGPGNYNIAGSGSKIGSKIGTSNRTGFDNKNSPGPGNYNISSKNDTSKITMGAKHQSSVFGSSFTPGPGNYNTISANRPGSGVTMGAKYDSKSPNEEPGPGAYNIPESHKPGAKIGTSKRTGLGSKDPNPGPGQYTYDKRPYSAGPKYGFGKSMKDGGSIQYQPGPGHYDSKTFLRNGEGGRTMAERFKSKDNNDMNPGPGYYNNDCGGKNTKGAKIGNSKRGNIGGSITPGPGAYGGDERRTGGTRFGTGQRSQLGRTDVPGPGAYESLHNVRGGITISGHKGKSKIDDNPGPGAYNPGDYNPKNRPNSANIGRSQRTNMQKGDTPGPGQYYKDGPQNYKFAYMKEPRSKQLKTGPPGPGRTFISKTEYEIPNTVPSAPHYLLDPSIYKSMSRA